jgi:hypothetical protein
MYKASNRTLSYIVTVDTLNEAKTIQKLYSLYKTQVRIRARGPRDGNLHDTPRANATHFDLYVK